MSKSRNYQEKTPGMKSWVKWLIGIVCVLVAGALIASSMIFTDSFYAKKTTALTVGDHQLSAAEMNYFFRESYYRYYQSMGGDQYLSYMTESILEDACEQAKTTYAVYDRAVAEGYTLSDEDITAIDEEVSGMDSTAAAYGLSNGDAFIAAMYGSGCNKASYRHFREVMTIASNYTNDKTDSQQITQQDIDSYYNEHKADFDTVTIRQFTVPVGDGDMAAAQEKAGIMAIAANEDPTAMDTYARQYCTEDTAENYAADNATLLEDVKISETSEEVRDWLSDESRQAGEVKVADKSDDSGVIVCVFLSRGTNNVNTVNVRHILFSVSSDADDAAKAEAKANAEEVKEEFLAGDKTEESFASLAKEHSADAAENGGLYENVYPGQMVSAFNDWCFDDSRKTGDCDIVETEYGYHIIYFCGEGKLYRDVLVETEMKNEYYEEWTGELTEFYTFEKNEKGMALVNTTVNSSSSES